MGGRLKGRVFVISAACALALMVTVSIVFAASSEAGKAPVGGVDKRLALELGTGPAQIKYMIDGETVPWGPIAFTVLSDGNISILDAGNRRILVVDPTGRHLQEISFDKLGLISPMDLHEWKRGLLAVVESNTNPQGIVLVDFESGDRVGFIELPSPLAEQRPVLMSTDKGGLQLVRGMATAHMVADASGCRPSGAILTAQPTLEVPRLGSVSFVSGDVTRQTSSAIRLHGDGLDDDLVSRDLGPHQIEARPIGSNGAGHLLLATAYALPVGRKAEVRFYVEALLPEDLRTIAYVPVPTADIAVWPSKYLSVTGDGRIWLMAPGKDQVVFYTLTPNPGQPAEDRGSVAHSIANVASQVRTAVVEAFDVEAALAHGSFNSPWSRQNGEAVCLDYWDLDWWCGAEAFYRSCGTAGGTGIDGNGRPRFITAYNRHYQWAPYAWGHWRTASAILNQVNSPGNDAGDRTGGSGHLTLSCAFGVDCSGLVSRAFGLHEKHGTANLAHHCTALSWSTPLLTGDIYLRPPTQDRGGHVIWHRFLIDANTVSCFEATTWNAWDRVANSSWTRSLLQSEQYTPYRYNNWTP